MSIYLYDDLKISQTRLLMPAHMVKAILEAPVKPRLRLMLTLKLECPRKLQCLFDTGFSGLNSYC